MAEKKKTTRSKLTKSVSSKTKAKKEPVEETYSFEELADIFGITKIKARAYFNMSQVSYNKKITIKQARELFNKF